MNIKSALYRSINQTVIDDEASSFLLYRPFSISATGGEIPHYKHNISLELEYASSIVTLSFTISDDKWIIINDIYSSVSFSGIITICNGYVYISSKLSKDTFKIKSSKIEICFGDVYNISITKADVPNAENKIIKEFSSTVNVCKSVNNEIVADNIVSDSISMQSKFFYTTNGFSMKDIGSQYAGCSYYFGNYRGTSDDTNNNYILLVNPYGSSYGSYTLTLKNKKIIDVSSNDGSIYTSTFDSNINVGDDRNINLTTGNINFTSDRRLKTNITPVQSSLLEGLLNTEISTFNYTSNPDATKSIGLMAQDIETNFPQLKDQLVTISEENGLSDKRSIKETKLVYVLWKALQEEAQKRKELEDKVEKLIKLIESKL